MIITNTITKKLLENIVHETFSKFGIISSSSLLDSLKFLGFSYATTAGISINIEDLKTPDLKKNFIEKAQNEITEISSKWQQGFVSDTERFQTIIDSWNIASESLKNRIVEYYQTYDPTNNLYLMAFSGARGNMSQVRQLVGMRGLMSDQEGKIIDLPIQSNFREGLSSIDYIISSYGARKGIVDTALKTADSGYLTRRLIYIAQDLIIRQKDCRTKSGILVNLESKTKLKNLIGRTILSIYSKKENKFINGFNEIIFTENTINSLQKDFPLILNIRSSLTCKSNGSICQYCYGWDLASNKLISLGEAVGIFAAQSIGEPGTQLTMRTFHTGGIFTGELMKQILASFSGKLILPNSLKTIPYRTTHGNLVLKLQQEIRIDLINWKGNIKEIFLDIGSYLYISMSSFIKKGDLIAESMTQSIFPGGRKLKPIYSSFSGEIRFENLLIRKMFRNKRTLKVNQDDGILWIASGKLFLIPKESQYIPQEKLQQNKPYSQLKLIFPYEGYVLSSENSIKILTNEKEFLLNFNQLKIETKNSNFIISLILQNYQYVDQYTLLGFIYFFPIYEGKIYTIRKKEAKFSSNYFLVTESDVWKINSDMVNDFLFFQDKKMMTRPGNLIHPTLKMKNAGFFLRKDGFKMIFQNAIPIFLSRGTILNYKQGDFLLPKKSIATLVNYTQQTEDIVQGLPKIEELIEARKPKTKSYLAIRPGILLNSTQFKKRNLIQTTRTLEKDIIKCIYSYDLFDDEILDQKEGIQFLYINHSIFLRKEIVVFRNKIYKITSIPFVFKPTSGPKKNQAIFKTDKNQKLLIHGKVGLSIWFFDEVSEKKEKIFKYEKNNLIHWLTLKTKEDIEEEQEKREKQNENINKKILNFNFVFKNKREDYILITKEQGPILLEYLLPILDYQLPLASKVIFNPGNFIDIGEPITEGIIDIHDLLSIFFKYHSVIDGMMEGIKRSLYKFQLLLVNSIQSIYQSQGVNISTKHLEIIVRQMTDKVVIKESGDTPFLAGELIRLSLISEIYEGLKTGNSQIDYKLPKFSPLLLSATRSALTKDGFLSAAGFQETKRVLTQAAIESSSDWLRGLKESIIVGRLIPTGSSFLNYKNYLDTLYLFKN